MLQISKRVTSDFSANTNRQYAVMSGVVVASLLKEELLSPTNTMSCLSCQAPQSDDLALDLTSLMTVESLPTKATCRAKIGYHYDRLTEGVNGTFTRDEWIDMLVDSVLHDRKEKHRSTDFAPE